jgi:hypothetical protein
MSIRGLCLQVMYMEFSFCKKKSSLEGNWTTHQTE